MFTLSRVRDFLSSYMRQNCGARPPYIELSAAEMAELCEGLVWHQGPTFRKCDTLYGIPVRVVD